MKKAAVRQRQTDNRTVYDAAEDLAAVERYMPVYNADIVRKILCRARPDKKAKVLDFGAGIGTLALEWRKQAGITPDTLEIDAAQSKILTTRKFKNYRKLSDVPTGRYDVIYTSNVLEHIEDDVATMKQLRQKLKPGGTIVIYLPALMLLWSQLDEQMGHYRRYERAELLRKAKAAGFKTSYCGFVDGLGVLASLFLKLRGYKIGQGAASGEGLRFYDGVVYRLSRVFDALGMRLVAGKNLLLVARKV